MPRELDTIEIEDISPEELSVVLRLLSSKLPPVIGVLNEGGNGWRQIMTIACYLLAATLNQHPEYTASAFALLNRLASYYPMVEAEFAKVNPGLVSELIRQDTAFILAPSLSASQETNGL